MDAHRIRQQARKDWIQRMRKKHGESFCAGDSTDDTSENLVVVGYPARIFDLSECGEPIDLIPLESYPSMSHDDNGGSSVVNLVDRFDIRHYLASNAFLDTSTSASQNDLNDDEEDDDWYMHLGESFDEQAIFLMEPDERRAYIDNILQSKDLPSPNGEGATSTGVPLQYDSEGNPIVSSPQESETKEGAAGKVEGSSDNDSTIQLADAQPFVPEFAVPEGIAIPKTQRHFSIIERTAQFINGQPSDKANQMELTIQGKQGNNPDFEFLNRSSDLHGFYTHIRWLMQTGLYGYNDGSDDSDDNEDNNENSVQSSNADPSNPQEPPKYPQSTKIDAISETGNEVNSVASEAKDMNPEPEQIESSTQIPSDIELPCLELRSAIDKTAELVAHSLAFEQFEKKLRVEKAGNSVFRFLSPFDRDNKYYVFRRDCFRSGTVVDFSKNNTDDTAGSSGALPGKGSVREKEAGVEAPPNTLTRSVDKSKEGDDGDDSIKAKRRRLALEFLRRRKKEE